MGEWGCCNPWKAFSCLGQTAAAPPRFPLQCPRAASIRLKTAMTAPPYRSLVKKRTGRAPAQAPVRFRRFQPDSSLGLRRLRPSMNPPPLGHFRFNRFRSRGPWPNLIGHGRGKIAVRRRRWNFRSRGPWPSLIGHGRGKIAVRRRRWNFRAPALRHTEAPVCNVMVFI